MRGLYVVVIIRILLFVISFAASSNAQGYGNDTDECKTQPCQNNGTCIDLINAYQCNCTDGFDGTNCTNDIDDCSPDPCQNNGNCTDMVNGYRCDCVHRFNGTNCENVISECLPGICLNNGTCTEVDNAYRCDCAPGFTGINCQNNSCGNTGDWSVYEGQCYRCMRDQLSWHSARSSCSQLGAHLVTISNSGIQTFLEDLCTIGDYWIGLNDLSNETIFVWDGTSTPVTYSNWYPGEPNDANTGEDCAHIRWDTHAWNDFGCERNLFYICQTPQDIDDCSQDPCQNNGTCIDQVNHFQCECVPGYNGTTCENMVNKCLPGLCRNNGTCTNLVNGYQCDCVPGFNETNCENNIDECASQPCQNNGTCIDLINGYQCNCTDGFNGTTCTDGKW